MSDELADVKDLLDVNEDTMRLKKVRVRVVARVVRRAKSLLQNTIRIYVVSVIMLFGVRCRRCSRSLFLPRVLCMYVCMCPLQEAKVLFR